MLVLKFGFWVSSKDAFSEETPMDEIIAKSSVWNSLKNISWNSDEAGVRWCKGQISYVCLYQHQPPAAVFTEIISKCSGSGFLAPAGSRIHQVQ